MDGRDEIFFKKLLSTFKVEAQEHIDKIASGLVELEKELPDRKRMEVIETVYREIHSLKGAARAVNMTGIESVCRSMEGIFSALKSGEINLVRPLFDSLHEAAGVIEKLLAPADGKQPAIDWSRITGLTQNLDSIQKKGAPPPVQKPQPAVAQEPLYEKTPAAETVRLSAAALTSLMLKTEEMISVKQAANQRISDVKEAAAQLEEWKREWKKARPEARKAQKLAGKYPALAALLNFIEWNGAHADKLFKKIESIQRSEDAGQHSFARLLDSLLDGMKGVLMMPVMSLLEIFPRLVRDMSADLGKEAELVIKGAEIEMDRRVLEEMKDPMIHIIRNCVDHGIEKPQERVKKKKPARGVITISVSRIESGKIEILVSDDGGGIDIEKVKSSARKLGIVQAEEAENMDEHEALNLIFKSGVSTSQIITDTSGRGLGLSIVREKIEKLGGGLTLETERGAGTRIRVVLPVTVSTFRGTLVTAGDHIFILPSANIERIARVNREEIKTAENKETVRIGDHVLSLARLSGVLGLSVKKEETREKVNVAVLFSDNRRIGFLVDDLIDERDVLVKKLGRQLSRVRNVTGAAVLGSGKVVPVLNVPDLMKSALKAAGVSAALPEKKEEAVERKKILVVEDSITSRTLLKNILESSGYDVKTAVDGIDAFTELKAGVFDIVVSDVDMPRMDGFNLTLKIRADKKLSGLPVVLVTALETREDRERGIDAGANAYVVKSSFDQNNLLEIIRKLI